jgi:very-short-patch-repair endonuclease
MANFEHSFMMRHHTEGIPVRSLAKEAGVHGNTLRRAMIKAGIAIKSRSDSMKSGYESGALKKREGFTITEEHRISISAANHGRKREAQTKNNSILNNSVGMSNRGASKNREAAQKGSKFERMLLDKLTQQGYNVLHQYELESYKIDLYIPAYKLAIEVDGISHREAIYGPDKLARSIEKDNEKDEFMKHNGMNILRVADSQKRPSLFNCLGISGLIGELCNKIKNGEIIFEKVEIK